MYLALALPSRRTVVTVHDLGTLSRQRGLSRWLFEWLWCRLPFSRAAQVTAVSEATQLEISDLLGIKKGQVRVIPNCLPGNLRWTPKKFNRDQPRILQVGTRANKNLETVIRALSCQPCELRIIGALTNQQREKLHGSGVTFSAVEALSDDEVASEYVATDMVVFLSLYEGFGLPILEAQAIGRPVIVSNREPMKTVAGEGALVVDPLDPEAAADAIKRVCQDDEFREQIVAAGLRNVRNYLASEVAAMYAEVYERVAIGSAS